MKILFIGATGLLAPPVIRHLGDKDHSLRLFSRSIKPESFTDKYEVISGDVFNPEDLAMAMKGCDAVHISMSNAEEAKAVEAIVETAKKNSVGLISYMSGATVCEENRWFKMIDNKYRAEQIVRNCGIPWIILRPGWFFESLTFMVRNGKATMLGTRPRRFHWMAAEDLGRLLTNAYNNEASWNAVHYLLGQEGYKMDDLLKEYCGTLYPEIRKVSSVPLPILRLIAFLTGNKTLKFAVALFAYFEKVPEPEVDQSRTCELLGKPEILFTDWLKIQKQKSGTHDKE